MDRLFVRVLAVALIAGSAGCGQAADDAGVKGKEPGTQNTLLPPLPAGVKIVLEAEDATPEPDMVIEEFKPVRHPDLGMQKASGGKCAYVPKGVNDLAKSEEGQKKGIEPKGKLTLKFSVPKEGKYCIYSRTYWTGGCSNSFTMVLDNHKPLELTDGTYYVWHWVTLRSEDPGELLSSRAFTLTQGEHTLVFANREDDTRLDQVYITDNPADKPAEIMNRGE